jgi:hypothetical protein
LFFYYYGGGHTPVSSYRGSGKTHSEILHLVMLEGGKGSIFSILFEKAKWMNTIALSWADGNS